MISLETILYSPNEPFGGSIYLHLTSCSIGTCERHIILLCAARSGGYQTYNN